MAEAFEWGCLLVPTFHAAFLYCLLDPECCGDFCSIPPHSRWINHVVPLLLVWAQRDVNIVVNARRCRHSACGVLFRR
ncbi:hypothetical protein BJY52DRAFT_1344365 [Lactarius psammicola]|nr:hypothetical protein BJY52DRAFT_1344365 [Lactarius psammicola]